GLARRIPARRPRGGDPPPLDLRPSRRTSPDRPLRLTRLPGHTPRGSIDRQAGGPCTSRRTSAPPPWYPATDPARPLILTGLSGLAIAVVGMVIVTRRRRRW